MDIVTTLTTFLYKLGSSNVMSCLSQQQPPSTHQDIKTSPLKMSCCCDVMYSPFLKCGEPSFSSNTGKNLCIHHLYNIRKSDDCAICLGEMCANARDVFLLSCGHMFHVDCLSDCKKPMCPMCRKQFTPEEATLLYYPKIIQPLAIKLFSLPTQSIEYVLLTFEIVLDVARVGVEATQAMFRRLLRRYSVLFI
jgi:hypothetical protein